MKWRIYSAGKGIHLIVTTETPAEAFKKALERFPRFMLRPGPLEFRPFREKEE